MIIAQTSCCLNNAIIEVHAIVNTSRLPLFEGQVAINLSHEWNPIVANTV